MPQNNRTVTLERLLDTGVVAVIRMKDPQRLLDVIKAISEGGVSSVEVTMTVPGAVQSIAKLVRELPARVLIGAGTVIDEKTAQDVIEAGARFVVGPILNLGIIALCHEKDTVVVPGCYSPTEIMAAWNAGADIVKVFPATSLGPKYFKDLRGPFPFLRLMPTGGVTIDNVGEWVKAGAAAVGIGSDLLDKDAIAEGRYEVLTERARRMTENFRVAKQSLSKS